MGGLAAVFRHYEDVKGGVRAPVKLKQHYQEFWACNLKVFKS